MGEDEEQDRYEEEDDVENGTQGFVGEVCERGEEGHHCVVSAREVFHDVLEIAHIAEEVFG